MLVTTQNQSVVETFCTTSIEVMPLDAQLGAELLYQGCRNVDTALNPQAVAENVSAQFGGLPLALIQIGSYMSSRKLPMSRFMAQYERDADRVEGRKGHVIDHEHTLATLWKEPLAALSRESRSLQQLLAFSHPGHVHEDFLVGAAQSHDLKDFAVLRDEIRYVDQYLERCSRILLTGFDSLCDAEEELLEAALIRKDAKGTLSLHPMVQAATLHTMVAGEKSVAAGMQVELLNSSFPTTWVIDVGHQHSSWERASQCLPHVLHMDNLLKRGRFDVQLPDSTAYAEMLLRCSW